MDDSYEETICLSNENEGLTQSKSSNASGALRINIPSIIPRILEHCLVITVHRQVDHSYTPSLG